MKNKPIAIDLFCGAGGVTKGLQDVGFYVIGIDNKWQPNYCGDEYEQEDALKVNLRRADFVWASPPCQRYTPMLNHGLTDRLAHPDLIEPTRGRLLKSGKPFIIENVAGAPLNSPVMLCGEMFGLKVTRHRFFESNLNLIAPAHPKHKGKGHRKQGDGGYYFRVYGHETGKRKWGEAMGIDWMRSAEIAQAIPPAYSNYLGKQVIAYLSGNHAEFQKLNTEE